MGAGNASKGVDAPETGNVTKRAWVGTNRDWLHVVALWGRLSDSPKPFSRWIDELPEIDIHRL